jgi:hypothetical protein
LFLARELSSRRPDLSAGIALRGEF